MNDEAPIPFVRLARKFFRSDLWREPREFSVAEAWLDMLSTASYAPETVRCDGKVLSLQAGELLASVRFLAVRWNWSKSRVARFLETLRNTDRITFWDNNGTETRRIRLLNWELYNPPRDKLGTQTGTPTGQPRDKYKEGEEVKKKTEERESSARPSLDEVRCQCQFIGCPEAEGELFWNHFEASGWIDKNGNRIHSWKPKLAIWASNAKAKIAEARHYSSGSKTADRILWDKELARVEERRRQIRSGYDAHQSIDLKDAEELRRLAKRRTELKEMLGYKV